MPHSITADDQLFDKKILITISVVTFNPDFSELEKTLDSLEIALNALPNAAWLITLVDNSTSNDVALFLHQKYPELPLQFVHGQGNIGFGRAHNIAAKTMGEFHLILNPDIQLSPDALINAVAFMRGNENCGMVSPHAIWPDGQRQYLCKQYPAVFDLFLRGFAPEWLRAHFSARLARYEMQSETQNEVCLNPCIVSGCFMFFRSTVFRKAGGFNDKFFLYFEDFDLSIRARKITDTAYVPAIKIIHAGGHASKKGLWHIKMFIRSALTFYREHGLKLF